jgi:hypothetical protein
MKIKLKTIVAIGLLAFVSLPACAEELAILRNGFAIRHVRHEERDGVTRLYLTETAGSYVEIATEDVERFEELEAPPLPPERTVGAPAAAKSMKEIVSAASDRSRIDPDLIESIIRAESGFNAKAVSHKGAQGLMQLMPATAARLGVKNAMDPEANVDGGARYLEELLARYNDDLVKALAAYNAGPKRVEQYRGMPPYAETRTYVVKVISDFNRKKMAEARTKQGQGNKPEVRRKSKNTAEKTMQESMRVRRPGSPA